MKRKAQEDEPLMTASGGNLIRGEIHRNERAPQCGVAKIEEAENKMNTNMKELTLHISLTPEPPRRLFFISPPVFCETPG